MKRGMAQKPAAAPRRIAHARELTIEQYEGLIKTSFRKLEQNPVLFVPNGLAFLVSLLLALGLLHMTGVLRIIMNVPATLTKGSYLATAIYALMSANPWRFWGIVVLYVVAEFFISLFFVTAKYGMIKDVILTGRASLARGVAFGKRHLLDVMGIYLASIAMIVLPIVVLLGLGLVVVPMTFGGIAALGAFVLLGLLYAAFVIYRLVFVYPVMTFEREGPMKSIRDDFHYVKTHVGHTFVTWLVLFGMGVVYVIVKSPVDVLRAAAANGYVVIILTGIVMVLEVLVSTWEHVFVFKAYLAGKGKK